MRNLKLAFRTLFKTPFVTVVADRCRSRSASARTRRSSRCSTRCCCGRCRCRDPARLVNLGAPGPQARLAVVQPGGRLRRGLQLPDVPRPREGEDRPFTGLAAHRDLRRQRRVQRPDAQRRAAMLVSGSYFPVLGLRPALGRLLTPTTTRRSAAHSVAVLSYATGERSSAPTRAVDRNRSSSTASR